MKILLADGQPYLIGRVQLRPAEHNAERVQTFAIDVSTTTADDAAFTTVLEATAADTNTLQEFALPTPVLAKYVRYRPLTNRGSTCCISTQQLTVLTGQQGGAAVTFTNLSRDADNNITAYRWDFGDGMTSTEQHPTHTYARPGTYPVKLTVTDAAGNTHSVTLNQRVFAPPTASFTFSPTQPNEGQWTVFTGTDSDPDGGPMLYRTWSWGDGTPSSYNNSALHGHAFADNGNYVVTFDVVDTQGQTTQAQQTVTVANVPPTVNVGEDRTWVGERELGFTAAISDPGRDTYTCRWDFGDGSAPSTDCAFRHTYRYTQPYDYTDACFVAAPPKVFTATLTVTDKDGGVSADSVQITVRPELHGSPDTIVTNGDFETPFVPSVFTMRPAPEVFGGWTVEFGSVDHISPDNMAPACGGQSVDVTGSSTGAIYQDLPTIPGQTYRLRFALAGNFFNRPAVKQLEVGWGSDLVDTVSFNTTGRSVTDMGWTYHDYTVTATASVTRLRFKSLTGGAYGPMVDDVSVVPVTVADPNQAPVANAGSDRTATSTTEVTLDGSGSSDPDGDALSYAWQQTSGPSVTVSGATTATASFTPTTLGSYSFTLTVSDGSLQAEDTVVVTVEAAPNRAPVATDQQITTVEDTATPMVLGATDADTDVLRYTITAQPAHGTLSGTAPNITYTPGANYHGVDSFTFQVNDGTADSNTATVRITIDSVNDAPSVTAGGPYTMDEGGTIPLTASGSDPDNTPMTFAWDLDRNGTWETTGASVTFGAVERDGPSTHTVVVQATDVGGLTATSEATITVANVAPTATLTAPATVAEGAPIELVLRDPSDVASADTAAGFRYAFDCGDGAGYGAWGTSASTSCPTADNGNRAVKGKLRDQDGGEREYTADVAVTNVAPSVGPITAPTAPLAVTTAVKTSASFTDPGSADTHTAVWDWGDGTTSAGTITAGTVGGSRTYAAPGVYTVTVTVQDDDGGAGSAMYQYVVVYDPSGGFVTGGGVIDSPKGASAANPDLTGRANFGFVAKYQKGATKPSGQTQFQFQAGDVNFHSTAYEWLVVAGPKAQYKGTGTINGTGSYGFLLTAIDGQVNGGGGTDRFRIKIWDTASGAIVYDNQRGATDDAAVTTALQSGSIVIHTGK
jgi:choice-of-anchor C domain-containing protein